MARSRIQKTQTAQSPYASPVYRLFAARCLAQLQKIPLDTAKERVTAFYTYRDCYPVYEQKSSAYSSYSEPDYVYASRMTGLYVETMHTIEQHYMLSFEEETTERSALRLACVQELAQ